MRRRPRSIALGLALAVALPVMVATGALHGTADAAACRITTDLKLGMRSGQVACLEARLRELGFGTVRGPDTFFGASTKSAVVAFQRSKRLNADGVVGPATRTALQLRDPLVATVPARVLETRVIGTSVQGRDIVATRMGTPGGRVVLVIGVIHGDEDKGASITALLKTLPTPAGIDLWLIDSMNPDGQALGTRGNANEVDLNRNFETGWSYIPKSPAHHQYSGEAADDQPETQAVESFIRLIRPTIGVWYHQDADVVSGGGARKEISKRYAELVGQTIGNVPCSQLCTGTAGTFANATVAGSANFLVELPGSAVVDDALILRHAEALLSVITM